MQHDVFLRLGDLARRQPLLVVDVAEDRLHQLRVGHAAVAGGISNHGDLLLGLARAMRPEGWAAPGSCRPDRLSTRRSAKSGPVVVFDVEDLDDRKLELARRGRSSSRKSIDAVIGSAGAPLLEREPGRAARSPNSSATWRLVTIVFVSTSQPVPTYVETRQTRDLDAADGLRRARAAGAEACSRARQTALSLSLNSSCAASPTIASTGRPTRSTILRTDAGSALGDARGPGQERPAISDREPGSPGSRPRAARSVDASVETSAFNHASRSSHAAPGDSIEMAADGRR